MGYGLSLYKGPGSDPYAPRWHGSTPAQRGPFLSPTPPVRSAHGPPGGFTDVHNSATGHGQRSWGAAQTTTRLAAERFRNR